jgi:hypothetical protein
LPAVAVAKAGGRGYGGRHRCVGVGTMSREP